MWGRVVAAGFACLTTLAPRLRAQGDCPHATLPAYAHNDYENDRPLRDALSLGYRGVEVDLFLIRDTLRVGHDRAAAARGARFDSLYLQPMQEIVTRCGTLTADAEPFLLTIEFKERSEAAFAALGALLARHGPLVGESPRPDVPVASSAPVEVILVGWHPPLDQLADGDLPLAVQRRLTERGSTLAPPLDARERLLSLDYGKTIGRWWRTARGRAQWMATLRAVAAAHPERRLRVFNAPNDARVLSTLFTAGVTIIGTKSLEHTRRTLTEANPEWVLPPLTRTDTVPRAIAPAVSPLIH